MIRKYICVIIAVCMILSSVGVFGFATDTSDFDEIILNSETVTDIQDAVLNGEDDGVSVGELTLLSNSSNDVTFDISTIYKEYVTFGVPTTLPFRYPNVVQIDITLKGLDDGEKINVIKNLRLTFDSEKATALMKRNSGVVLAEPKLVLGNDSPYTDHLASIQELVTCGDGYLDLYLTPGLDAADDYIEGNGNDKHLLTCYIQLTDPAIYGNGVDTVFDSTQIDCLDITVDTTNFAVYNIIDSVPHAFTYKFTPENLTVDLREEMTGVTASGDTVTYDGELHNIEVTGAPEGSTITYTCNGEEFTGAKDAGEYEVTATVECPGYKPYTATQVLVIKTSHTPIAYDVTISGDVAEGNQLTGSYTFYQSEDKADASEYKWVYSDAADGIYTDIPGATGITYIVEAPYADKYIKFKVTPRTSDGMIGYAEYSNFLYKACAPGARNITINGDFIVGGSVEASYEYYDVNNDSEGETIFQWYASDYADSEFTPILGATSKTYTFTENEINKYIKVEVIPVSTVAPEFGEAVMSEGIFGPATPVATNVSVSKSGSILNAHYIYTHIHGIKEKNTKYEWLIDGTVVSAKSYYEINFTGTKTVTLAVTPCAEFEPCAGETVYAQVIVTGNQNIPSGGGASGGGSSVVEPDVTFDISTIYKEYVTFGVPTTLPFRYPNVVQIDITLKGLDDGEKINVIKNLRLTFDSEKATALMKRNSGVVLAEPKLVLGNDSPYTDHLASIQELVTCGDGYLDLYLTPGLDAADDYIEGNGNDKHLLTCYIQLTDPAIYGNGVDTVFDSTQTDCLDITVDTTNFAVSNIIDCVPNAFTYEFTQKNLTVDLRDEMPGVSASGKEVPYDGNAYNIDVTGAPEGSTTTYTYKKDNAVVSEAKDAGEYEVTATVECPGYKPLTLEPKTLTISPKNITANVTIPAERTYDGTANVGITSITLDGKVTGDDVSIANAPTTGTMVDKHVGENKEVTIDALTLTGADAKNYTFTQPKTIPKINITKANVTFKGISVSTKINEELPTGTLYETIGTIYDGDNLSGNFKINDLTDPLTAGDYSITNDENNPITIDDGNNGGNYNITCEDGILVIELDKHPDPIASELSFTYGESKEFNLTLEDVDADTVTVEPANEEVVTVSYDNATKKITVTPVKAGNTEITVTVPETNTCEEKVFTASVTVAKKALTYTVTAEEKIYNGDNDFVASAALDGIVNDDDVYVDCIGASIPEKNVGEHVGKVQLKLIGDDADNYVFVNEESDEIIVNDITVTVVPKEIAATVEPVDRVYDGTIYFDAVVTLGGVVAGDEEFVTATATGELISKNVGAYDANVTVSLSGDASVNYVLAEDVLNTSVEIYKKEITASVVAADKVYDGKTDINATATLVGVLGGDTVINSVVADVYSKNVATYTNGRAIVSIAGIDADNYELAVSEFNEVEVAISPKELMISNLKAIDKIYDGTVAISLTGGAVEGIVDGDNVYAVIPTEGTVADASAGNNKAVTIAEITLSGADVANYTLVQPTGITVNIIESDVPEYIPSSINLLLNADFERGDLLGWSTGDGIIEIAGKEGARTGIYGVHLKPRSKIADTWYQTVSGLTIGKRYILGGWVKKSSPEAVDITNFWPYSWNGLSRVGDDYGCNVGNEWGQSVGAFTATSTSASVDFVSFHTMNADAYLDDLYFGELVIADIETFDTEPITIPSVGTVKVPVTSGKVLNQLGTTHGLIDEKIMINIPEQAKGVVFDGNNLIIDDSAIAGTYTFELYCVPSYPYPAQDRFYKLVEIELLAGSNTKPEIRNLKITGEMAVGNTLTATYEFYQVEGKMDASVCQWKYADFEYGNYYPISGATSLTFTVTEEYADKFIRLYMIPLTIDGMTGQEVFSNCVSVDKIPDVINLDITGDFNVGSKLTGVYELANPDADNKVIFRWLVSDTEDGIYELIGNGNRNTLVLTDKHIDKYIKFCIIYVQDDGNRYNYFSKAYFGPSAPTVSDIVIDKSMGGYLLSPTYTIYQAHGAVEADTKFEWKVEGELVSTKREYFIDYFDESKIIELIITPMTESNPAYGEPVTVTFGSDGRTVMYSGKCGKEVNWRFDNSGILTISGTGAMTNYPAGRTPWNGLPVSRIVVENGITHIGDNAFCLSSQIVDGMEFISSLPETLESIGNNAFSYVSNMKQIVIPVNVKVIGNEAFAHCYELEKVVIPEGVERIGFGAFSNCILLESIYIPDSVTELGYSAFQNCHNLENVRLSENLTMIEYFTFANCDLKNIEIPCSVTLIGYGVFDNCNNVENIYYYGSESFWNSEMIIEDENLILAEGNVHFYPLRVTYDLNYPDSELTVQSAPENSEFIIAATIPEREGYKFIGWSFDCNSSNSLYQAGDVINTTTEDITLYAIWKKFSIDVYGIGNTYTVIASSLPENCEILFATYNGDKLSYFDSYTYDNSASVEFTAVGAYDNVKIMVWKSLSKPIPLTKSVEFAGYKFYPEALNVQIIRSGDYFIGKYEYFHSANIPEGKSLYEWRVDGNIVSDSIEYKMNFSGTRYVTFTVTPVCTSEPSYGNPVTVGAYVSGYIPTTSSGGNGVASLASNATQDITESYMIYGADVVTTEE